MDRPTWLSVCVAVLVAPLALSAGLAWGQPPRLQSRVMAWQAPESQRHDCFAILGEVLRPGVYSAAAREVTLQELVAHAGGLTPTASTTVRVIRQSCAAQSMLFGPEGRDPLQPNDIIVVDPQREPRRDVPQRVWLCFDGILDRPIVVPVHPENARLSTIVKMLDQSPELASTIRLIVPPRHPWPTSIDTLLPNGTVLQFDRKLLVTQNLPEFPQPISLREPATTAPAFTAVPSAENVVANPVATDANPPRVEAIPVPFPSVPDQVTASPSSLPIPGHPLAPEPPGSTHKPSSPATASFAPSPSSSPAPSLSPSSSAAARVALPRRAPAVSVDPAWVADSQTEILPAPKPPELPAANLAEDDRTAELTPTRTGPLSLWHMLGIGGTVAGLIGLAIVTRKYLDQHDSTTGRSTATHGPRPVPLAQRRSTTETNSEAPPAPASDRSMEPDDLSVLLCGDRPIVTEPIELPQHFRLQRVTPSPARHRLDVQPQTLAGPHRPVSPSKQPREAVALDTAAAPPVPAPHFGSKSTQRATERYSGSVVERALAQLQEGPRS